MRCWILQPLAALSKLPAKGEEPFIPEDVKPPARDALEASGSCNAEVTRRRARSAPSRKCLPMNDLVVSTLRIPKLWQKPSRIPFTAAVSHRSARSSCRSPSFISARAKRSRPGDLNGLATNALSLQHRIICSDARQRAFPSTARCLRRRELVRMTTNSEPRSRATSRFDEFTLRTSSARPGRLERSPRSRESMETRRPSSEPPSQVASAEKGRLDEARSMTSAPFHGAAGPATTSSLWIAAHG